MAGTTRSSLNYIWLPWDNHSTFIDINSDLDTLLLQHHWCHVGGWVGN